MTNEDETSAIQKKVVSAAVLINQQGLSVTKAAAKVGLKRTTLGYHLKKMREANRGDKPGDKYDKPDKPGDKHDKRQNQHRLGQTSFLSKPQSRSAEGKFLPGVSGNPGGQRKITAESRGVFEDFTPTVAREITKIFTELCEDEDKDYELILTYAKEILDRGLGKPKQAVDLVDTTSEDEEYEFLQEHLLGDVEALRLAAALSHHLEVKSSIDGRAPEPGAVENVPPPPGAGPDPGPGCEWKDLSEDNNLDASSIG